jgi:hypothetical protein
LRRDAQIALASFSRRIKLAVLEMYNRNNIDVMIWTSSQKSLHCNHDITVKNTR